MSTQKGNGSRTRTQKHKNRTVFRNDLHDKTPQRIFINALHICEVCQHCKSVIEWKIKYKKYKPLSQTKVCNKCGERNIRKAYHVMCRDCAVREKVCPKCSKSWNEVQIEPAVPTPSEDQKLQSEMDRLVKSLSERKRRTFQRFMSKGKPHPVEGAVESESSHNDDSDDEGLEKKPRRKRIPHTKDELLEKIRLLTLIEDNDEDDDDEDGGDSVSDDCCSESNDESDPECETKTK